MRFGTSLCIEGIGASGFERTAIEVMSIHDSVRELCGRCFKESMSLGVVRFGSLSREIWVFIVF